MPPPEQVKPDNTLRITLGLMFGPIVLSLIGWCLSSMFSCTGMNYVEHCEIEALTGLISALVSIGWLGVVSLPLGMVFLAIYLVFSTYSRSNKN